MIKHDLNADWERGNISKVLKCKLTKHVSPLIVYEKERLLSIKLHKGYLEHAHWTNILFTVMLYVFRHAATVEPISPRLNLIRFDLVISLCAARSEARVNENVEI